MEGDEFRKVEVLELNVLELKLLSEHLKLESLFLLSKSHQVELVADWGEHLVS